MLPARESSVHFRAGKDAGNAARCAVTTGPSEFGLSTKCGVGRERGGERAQQNVVHVSGLNPEKDQGDGRGGDHVEGCPKCYLAIISVDLTSVFLQR